MTPILKEQVVEEQVVEAKPQMSNLTKRILTALVGVPVVAVLTWLGGWWFVGLIAVLVVGAQYEFYKMSTPRLSLHHVLGGMGIGALIVVQQYVDVNLLPAMVLLSIGLIAWDTFDVKIEAAWTKLAWMITGLIYPAWLFGQFVHLRNDWTHILSNQQALWLIVGLLLIVWTTDSLAYFTGRAIGKTPLAPAISPKKTWEGTIGGFVGAVVVAIILKLTVLDFFSWQDAMVCAVIGGAGGQIGDLAESRLKRLCGVKDSGNILPGHGGILDRIDGLILVVPLYYLYLAQFGAFL